ncbi:LuxR family transcriptional regulator [Pseudomonas sp. FP198]|jgi:LuxR family quorum-sensing system transcriptional regulator ExpR|uniref:helix-turn-helix transcriptional regulator n=1 Tax=Pseudomonas sp. FP198 TaxID=2954084 RepID=UPI0027354B79|nr:LuxR family transcriptional regulator [Pseudomonas sp. FP198]WLG96778.1 LuxR family transcriptional regulator [Pseudomonas sp. FP198]
MSSQAVKGRRVINTGSELDERLKSTFEKCLRPLDGCHYAYFVMYKGREVKPRIFSNYPKRWLDVYKAENYHLVDPVIKHGLKCIAPFFWHEALESKATDQGQAVFASSEKYQISDGFTFNLHDANGLFAALSISNTERRKDFEQTMMRRAAEIQMTLIQFQHRLTDCFSLSELFPELTEAGLSDRELGVLKWVVMGKAYSEIAAIHAISVRTVKFHMANIVDKLSVCNAKQAVYKAVSLGLV